MRRQNSLITDNMAACRRNDSKAAIMTRLFLLNSFLFYDNFIKLKSKYRRKHERESES